jgi:hypothetical protein
MGTIKAIIGVVAIVGSIYAAWQIVPPELSNYSFQDDLRNIAMMGAANPHETEQDVLNQVLKKAEDHQIVLTAEQVTVQRIGTPGAPAIYVAADYSVPVSLPGYTLTLHFTPNSGNKGF